MFSLELPIDVYEVIITQTSFDAIMALAEVNRALRALFDCGTDVTELSFFADSHCHMLPNKLARLRQINARFNLVPNEDITFAKMKRAYYRSAYNPECRKYSSLINCLKSAARIGRSETLKFLLSEWQSEEVKLRLRVGVDEELNKLYQDQLTSSAHNHRYTNMLLKLSVIAHKNDHRELGQMLLDLEAKGSVEAVLMDKALYWRTKSWLKHLLMPYKVASSQDIREKYSSVLYDPKVSDVEKIKIWRNKYAIVTESTLENMQQKIPGDLSFLIQALAIKLGIKTASDYNVPCQERGVLAIIKAQVGILLPAIQSTHITDAAFLQVLKRGYYGTIASDGNLAPELGFSKLLIWGNLRDVFVFLRKFKLSHLREFYHGLNSLQAISPPLIDTIILGGCSRAYFEYIQTDKIPIKAYSALGNTKSGFSSLRMVADIMKRITSFLKKSKNLYKIIEAWQVSNVDLLVKIWLRNGRQEYENMMIYLRSEFLIMPEPETAFLSTIVSHGASSLVAYIFGYDAGLNTEIPSLHHMTNDDLRYSLRNRSFTLMNPDVFSLLLDITQKDTLRKGYLL